MKPIILLLIAWVGHLISFAQSNPLEKENYEYYVSGTSAYDTNSFDFLNRFYLNFSKTINQNDTVVVFLEVPEDDILYCMIENIELHDCMYELCSVNLIGKTSATKTKLGNAYSKLYSSIISQAKFSENFIVRGNKNPLQCGQIWLMNLAFPQLINQQDSLQIAGSISSKSNLNPEIYIRLIDGIQSSNSPLWIKLYGLDWIERLSNQTSNITLETYWKSQIEKCNKKLFLSPWIELTMKFGSTQISKYFKQPEIILFNSHEAVLCKTKGYKTISTKKVNTQANFVEAKKGEMLILYSPEKRKYIKTHTPNRLILVN